MSNMNSFVEAVRLIDALLAAGVVGILAFRTRRFWRYYDNQQKALVAAFYMYVITVSYTSFELYAQDATIGFRSFIALFANVFAIVALTRNKKPGLMTLTEFNRVKMKAAREARKRVQ